MPLFFFKKRLYMEPPLQMVPKRAAPINPFVGAAGVISRPLQMALFIGAALYPAVSTNQIYRDGLILSCIYK
jgi:hypothetical protein